MPRTSGSTVTTGLQRRLVIMLLVPLVLLALVSAWFDYQSADDAALQKDRHLRQLVPLLADSVLSPSFEPGGPPLMLLAPQIDEFLRSNPEYIAYAVNSPEGTLLDGAPWLAGVHAATAEPEFRSEEYEGVTYRIVAQLVYTNAGALTLVLADGSDPRQQWMYSVLYKVLLPNLVLIAAAAFAVNWAIRRALRPLLDLKEALERRSPRDLSALDEEASPDEVRPLVQSLNRLFGLVNAQAESQRRFIADAAHQLRTPLAALQAQVEAWAQAANAAAATQAAQAAQAPSPAPGGDPRGATAHRPPTISLRVEEINRLRNASRRTSQLANQLLALSRADTGAVHAQPRSRVDLPELCANILESRLDAATARHIDLGLEVEPAQVVGHDWLLRELLVNLVDNAVKYTPVGGTVTIRCGIRATGRAFLEVEDDGPGVPAAERARVLERFYRLPDSPGEGNGLGLAIASEIAHLHHSALALDSGARGYGLRIGLEFAG